MKKILFSVFGGLVAGALGGFIIGIFAYPYIFPPAPAMEQVVDRAAKTLVAGGTFIHANPSDPVHYGQGSVEILRDAAGAHEVHLKPDFKVGPGPRFHVYLADKADITTNDHFKQSKVTDLGMLRSFEGSQIFKIPPRTDVTPVKSIVVWCKEFGVLISPATLKTGS
jgi:hypothetical protein